MQNRDILTVDDYVKALKEAFANMPAGSVEVIEVCSSLDFKSLFCPSRLEEFHGYFASKTCEFEALNEAVGISSPNDIHWLQAKQTELEGEMYLEYKWANWLSYPVVFPEDPEYFCLIKDERLILSNEDIPLAPVLRIPSASLSTWRSSFRKWAKMDGHECDGILDWWLEYLNWWSDADKPKIDHSIPARMILDQTPIRPIPGAGEEIPTAKPIPFFLDKNDAINPVFNVTHKGRTRFHQSQGQVARKRRFNALAKSKLKSNLRETNVEVSGGDFVFMDWEMKKQPGRKPKTAPAVDGAAAADPMPGYELKYALAMIVDVKTPKDKPREFAVDVRRRI